MKLYTIYDAKAEAYLGPYTFPTPAFALREFAQQVNTPGTNFNKWPADYTLFELGEWDERTADFTQHDAKVPLGLGIEYVDNTPQDPRQLEIV